jgi:triphosphatase
MWSASAASCPSAICPWVLRKPRKLRTVYFDTPKHDLHAAGISLRLRCQNGGWLQTVKADQHVVDGVSNPIELEAPVAGEEPDLAKIADKKIKRVIQKAVQGTTLHPVFETIVRRTTRKIKAQGSEIELAVDDGAVRAGQGTRELRKAELELKAGSAEGLLLAAEKLLGDHELKLSTRSKAERGYRLALGKKGANAEPEKARPARITCKISCAEAFSANLESATRQILVNRQAVLETDDPDALINCASDCGVCATLYVRSGRLSIAGPCRPSSARHETRAEAWACCGMPTS